MSQVEHYVSQQGPDITLTHAAKKHFLTCLSGNPNYIGVRFSTKKTGCSGLSYVVDFVEKPEEQDICLDLVDHYRLFIAKSSYPFLKGLNVDYVREGLNFKLAFNNPNQTGQCGCGESFTID